MKHSLEELLVMTIPTFVDLVVKKFIIKEVVILKQGIILAHFIFTSPVL